jgi:hypothetical protein
MVPMSEICNDLILAQSMPWGPSTPTLLRRAALIVEGSYALGRPCQVGDDDADARIKLAWVPLDLGHYPAGFFQLCA